MREVITRVWCDEHLAHSERVEGVAVELGEAGRWFSVDLCPQCVADKIDPLRDFLADFGVPEVSGVVPVQVIPQATTSPRPAAPAAQVEAPALFPPTAGPAEHEDERADMARDVCSWPGCGEDLTRGALARHYLRVHGVDRRAFTQYCPLCDEPVPPQARHSTFAHDLSLEQVWSSANASEDGRVRARAQRFREEQVELHAQANA